MVGGNALLDWILFVAQRALQIQNGLIKSRPICEASALSQSVAIKNDLKPAMKRPQTSLQTARRLITTHLGAKTTLSKEVLERERKVLRDARGKYIKNCLIMF